MCVDAICGGGHLARFWTQEEIAKHEACIDCYCGIPFKREGMVEYRYYSCTAPVGERCSKHGVVHKAGSGIWILPKRARSQPYANKEEKK